MEKVSLKITRSEFTEFRNLQHKRRWDWPATFSANRKDEIWPYRTSGLTPLELRKNLRGVSPLLDRIATKYRMARPKLGRFFINDRGAFYKDDAKIEYQFVEFVWEDKK